MEEENSVINQTVQNVNLCHLLDAISLPIAYVDDSYIFQYINHAFCIFFQKDKENILGRSIIDMVDSDFFNSIIRPNFERCLNGETVEYQHWFDITDTIKKYIKTTLIPMQSRESEISGLILQINDITENKKKQEVLTDHKKRAEQYLQLAGTMLMTLDQDGSIILLNKKGYQILGYNEGELIGENWFDTCIPEEKRDEIKNVFQRIIEGQIEPVEFYENPIVRKDGTQRLVSWHNTLLHDDKGTIIAVLSSGEDITDKKKIEEKLLRIFDLSSDLICEADINTATFTKINPAFTKILGYTEKELLSHSFLEFIHPEDKEKTIHILEDELQKGNRVISFVNRYRCKDGTYVWLDWNSHPVPELGFTYAIARDITDWKNAEKIIKESEETNRSIIESIPMGIHMYQLKKGNRLEFIGKNPAADRLLGVDNEQFIGKSIEEAFPALIDTEVPERYRRAARDGEFWFTEQINYKHGEIAGTFEVYVFQMASNKAAVLFNDVSERMKSNEKITTLSTIVEQSLEGVIITDLEGNITYANDAWYTIHNYPKDAKLLNKNIHIFHTKEQYEKEFKPFIKKVLLEGRFSDEINHIDRDGKIVTTLTSTSILKDKDQNPIALATIANDITKLKKAENIIKKNEQFLTDIFESISDGISVLDKDLHILRTNNYMKKMYRHKGSITGRFCYEIYQERTTPCPWCPSIIAFHTKTTQTSIVPYPNEKKPTRWIFLSAYPLIDTKGNVYGVIEYLKDITEQKKAETELEQAHKLLLMMNEELEAKVLERTADVEELLTQKDEFINQLGHDIKNPLGPLLQLLPILKRQETDQKRIEMFDVMIRNVQYMKNLVSKTIELARLNSPDTYFSFEPLDIDEEIKKTIEHNVLLIEKHHITLHTSIPDDLPMVQADVIHLQELLTNLIHNAVKYSKEHGTIDISACKEEDDVFISIKDDGIGMTKTHIKHLFDEFYKADESRHDFNSSGLGMPICKRIVERHGGKIWAESEGLDKGSSIHFSLKTTSLVPATENKPLEEDMKKPSRIHIITHRGKEILYLDYAQLEEDDYDTSYQEIEDFIIQHNKRDLLLLINVTGNYFNIEQVRNTKNLGKIVRPYLKKNAIIGLTKNQEVFLKAIKLFTSINIKPFTTMEEAKEWLVQ